MLAGVAAACGGGSKGAEEPGGADTCATAAGNIATLALADASPEVRAEIEADATAGVVSACNDGDWTQAQIDCFADAQGEGAMQACVETLSAEQGQVFTEAMAPIFGRQDNAVDAQPPGGEPGGGEPDGMDPDDGGE